MADEKGSILSGIDAVREEFKGKIPTMIQNGTERWKYTKNKRSQSGTSLSHVVIIKDKIPGLIQTEDGDVVEGNNKIAISVSVSQSGDHDMAKLQKAIATFLSTVHKELE